MFPMATNFTQAPDQKKKKPPTKTNPKPKLQTIASQETILLVFIYLKTSLRSVASEF